MLCFDEEDEKKLNIAMEYLEQEKAISAEIMKRAKTEKGIDTDIYTLSELNYQIINVCGKLFENALHSAMSKQWW